MAQSTGITVIALSQLTTQEYNKDGSVKAPRMDDLRESRQISQDADIILLLYRPWPDNKDKQGRVLLVRKNKEGELGSIDLDFDGKYQTFARPGEVYEPLREDYDYLPNDTPVPFEPEQTQMKF